MATVDSLDIRISAQASKASSSLDNLVSKLNTLSTSLSRINGSGLTGLANGVNKLSVAMQGIKTVGTADFTRLAKNIEKLGNINTANLNSAASSMSQLTRAFNQLGGVSANAQQVGELAKNISKLGSKSAQSAVANIPQLATAMQNLMQTLSTAPKVSDNVIRMTNTLANLASQGGKVGATSNTLVNGLNRSTSAMNRAAKSSKSLAAAFGKFYATWFLVIRGVKKLWSSIKSSMNYIEVLNYFDAAFTQVAEKADLSSWQELGYASAEEYANSFAERAKELTSKMTGFEISPTGTLEATGIPSLGLDPSQLMNYQAMFGQMASSMGVTSETAVKLSSALSMIGADLASVKNMDFDKVWTDMASGLAGMSRTLDKYGVNIRNVNLQQKLTELGIDANITALNQNDKALLRTIILLDSTRYAWGDLADTINQPANQLRLITANFQNLARTIGNLFLPIVQKVLPYINALVIALQRLFTWIGNLLGVDLSKISNAQKTNENLESIYDSIEDVADGYDDAKEAAKEYENQLLGFDEITKLQEPKDTDSSDSTDGGLSSGILDAAFEDALSEYQKVWDEAFANMENRSQEMADKIVNAFKSGNYEKIGTYISSNLANALETINWDSVYEGARNFGSGLASFLNGLISPDLFGAVGRTIAGALNTKIYTALSFGETFDFKNFGKSIASGINNFFKTFDFEALAESFNVWAQGFADSFISFISNVEWSTILKGAWDFLKNIDLETLAIVIAIVKIKKILKVSILKTTLNSIGTTISRKIAQAIASKLGVEISANAGIGTALKTGITTALASVGGIGNLLTLDVTALAAEGGFAVAGLTIGTAIIGGIAAAFAGWNFGQWINKKITGEDYSFSEQFSAITEGFKDGTIKDAVKLWWKDIKQGFEDGWELLYTWLKESTFGKWIEENVTPWFKGETWKELWSYVKEDFREGWQEFKDWWNSTALVKWFNYDVKPWFTLDKWKNLANSIKDGIANKWNEFKDWWKNNALTKWWNENVAPFFSKEKWNLSGIKDGLKEAFNSAIDGIKGIWNSFAEWINNALSIDFDGFSKKFNVMGKKIEIGIPAFSINLGHLPTFAVGGFPEDGLFFANHNELVGQFSNGKTAVANNEQITEGIASAVYKAFVQANNDTQNNNQQPIIKVYVGNKELEDITIEGINNRIVTSGKSPFLL